MRFLAVPSLCMLLAGCHIPSVSFERVERREIETQPLTAVSVETFNGGIDVVTHDQPFVDLEVTYRAYGESEQQAEANCGQLSCDIQADAGKLTIKAAKPKGHWMSAAKFKLKVPAACDLELRSSNGKLAARDLEGNVSAESSNGELDLANIAGGVTLKTSNGRISLQNIYGPIDAESSNGRVSYSGLPVGQENRIRTSNGRVEVRLPQDALVEVHGRTSNGRVQCQLNTSDIFKESKREWSGIVAPQNSGLNEQSEPAKLTIRTSNGSITISANETSGQSGETEQPEEIPTPAETSGEISDEITL